MFSQLVPAALKWPKKTKQNKTKTTIAGLIVYLFGQTNTQFWNTVVWNTN